MSPFAEFARVRVLCVGDVMLDRFVQGIVQRISPESPVPVVLLGGETCVPGGAANVARNVAALGGHCTLIGCVGEDAAAAEIAARLADTPLVTATLIAEPGRATVEKTRFVAAGQHLLRADREQQGTVSDATARAVIARVQAAIADHDVLVLSDYAKGLLTDAVIAAAVAAARAAGVPVVVDPKSPHLSRYAGASVVTPNAREAAAASGIPPSDDAAAEAAGRAILAAAALDAVLLTRAERGMTLVTRDAPARHISATSREVFDVVGAGDTVIAALALCLGSGRDLAAAAGIANAAAGVVVGKAGTATLDRDELRAALGGARGATKHATRVQAVAQRGQWGGAGLRVGFTNGCFDVLHAGHAALLEAARARCDRLIVGLNDDASVRRLKGPTRPVNTVEDRAALLAALAAVDLVVPFDEDTPAALIDALAPDLLVKGGDYAPDAIVGADSVRASGGEVVTIPLLPGRSTTAILARAR